MPLPADLRERMQAYLAAAAMRRYEDSATAGLDGAPGLFEWRAYRNDGGQQARVRGRAGGVEWPAAVRIG
ncbi:hypothetical protein G6F57_023017 [Rhizopus arrhizus]|nr:hypothetical protein G6F57_023017 [Rhizopus arrhizus]